MNSTIDVHEKLFHLLGLHGRHPSRDDGADGRSARAATGIVTLPPSKSGADRNMQEPETPVRTLFTYRMLGEL